MNWKKAIGFGFALWLVMFALVSGVVAYGSYESSWAQGVLAIVAGVLAFAFAAYTEMPNFRTALGYGLSWIAIGLALDYLVTYRFNPDIFSSWALWVGYALVIVATLVSGWSFQTAESGHKMVT